MPGVECLASDGTFYSFPRIQKLIDASGEISNDVDFAAFLLEKVGLALVPGSAFGAPGYVRISYAASMPILERALDRFEKAAKMLLNA